MASDPAFGSEFFEHHSFALRREGSQHFLRNLDETDIAEMYLWLAKRYPHEEDPKHETAHAVSPREEISWFRDDLLRCLVARATPSACAELYRIKRELANPYWMKWHILEAEDNSRRNSWAPPGPKDILEMAQDNSRRYVENGQQLLDVLGDSLDRLEHKLQGTMAAAEELWDNHGDVRSPSWFPRGEDRISNYVARYLQDDLTARKIVVNREVQIRPPADNRTDILVDAFITGRSATHGERISAIIETKGCWHREVKDAMKSQLVDRYLAGNQCPIGLYLVIYCNCDKWSELDTRKKQAPEWLLADSREHFRKQAEALMSTGEIPDLELRSFVLRASLPDNKDQETPAAP
jgi:hypothetical protein